VVLCASSVRLSVTIFYTEPQDIIIFSVNLSVLGASDIKGQVRKSGHLVNGTADVDLNDLKSGLYIIRSGGCSAKIVKL